MIGVSLDWILGSTTKVRMLRALLPLRASVTGRELQRLAGVRSTAGIRQALEELASASILVRSGSPTTHQYQINREHHLIAPLEALFRAEGEQARRLAELLVEVLEEAGVRGVVQSVVLFGSRARGDARPDSDLDLLLVTSGSGDVGRVEAAVLDAADVLAMRLGVRVAPMVIAAERAAERTHDGDPLMQNILGEGRALLGDALGEVVGSW